MSPLKGWRLKAYSLITPILFFYNRLFIKSMARAPDKKYRKPDFNPLLAIHRVNKIELDKRKYTFPKDYDFQEFFNKNFGVIKDENFNVELEFTGYAAAYVSERILSPDQKITKKRNGAIKLRFSASSEPELTSWVLSFGEEAKVIKPDWLANDISSIAKGISKNYSSINPNASKETD